VISLRGRIIPVYDLVVRLRLRSEVSDRAKMIVIVEAGSETAGVIVDGVEEVLTVGPDQIEDVPGADSALIDRIVKVDDRLIVLLEAGSIVSKPDLAAT
jgi:purine-binding chemotaxis protein CheW